MKCCSKCDHESVLGAKFCQGCGEVFGEEMGVAGEGAGSGDGVDKAEVRAVPSFIRFVFVFIIALGWFSLMSALWTRFFG